MLGHDARTRVGDYVRLAWRVIDQRRWTSKKWILKQTSALTDSLRQQRGASRVGFGLVGRCGKDGRMARFGLR